MYSAICSQNALYDRFIAAFILFNSECSVNIFSPTLSPDRNNRLLFTQGRALAARHPANSVMGRSCYLDIVHPAVFQSILFEEASLIDTEGNIGCQILEYQRFSHRHISKGLCIHGFFMENFFSVPYGSWLSITPFA